MARMARMGYWSQTETGLEVPGLAQECGHPIDAVWFSKGFSYGERKVQPRQAKDNRKQRRQPPGAGCHVWLALAMLILKPHADK